jgi:hypothetical protein
VAFVGVLLGLFAHGRAHRPTAQEVLRAVNGAYEDLRPIPRRIDMRFRTRMKSEGQPETITHGEARVYQVDRRIRFETLPDSMKVESDGPAGPRVLAGGELLWVHDGSILRTRYTMQNADPGAPPIVHETLIDHTRVPEEFGSRYTDPMAEPELAAEILAHPFTLTREPWNGTAMEVLRSEGPILFSDRSRVAMRLWVDPEDHLVRRVESETTHRAPGADTTQSIEMQAEYVYHLQVPIEDSAFELALGPQAKDMTEALLEDARAKAPVKP